MRTSEGFPAHRDTKERAFMANVRSKQQGNQAKPQQQANQAAKQQQQGAKQQQQQQKTPLPAQTKQALQSQKAQSNQQNIEQRIQKHAEELLKNPRAADEAMLLVADKMGTGVVEEPYLSPRWLDFELHGVSQRLSFLPYTSRNDADALQLMNHDVSLLLRFKHHVFWSYVLFDKVSCGHCRCSLSLLTVYCFVFVKSLSLQVVCKLSRHFLEIRQVGLRRR